MIPTILILIAICVTFGLIKFRRDRIFPETLLVSVALLTVALLITLFIGAIIPKTVVRTEEVSRAKITQPKREGDYIAFYKNGKFTYSHIQNVIFVETTDEPYIVYKKEILETPFWFAFSKIESEGDIYPIIYVNKLP